MKFECPDDCGGCSCHIAPPCPHCTDHSRPDDYEIDALANVPMCKHERLTPGFMAGSYFCNDCPARIRIHFDGKREVLNGKEEA